MDKKNRKSLLKSNWAEYYVAERLSRCDCYVRTVPQGRDTGIDLYCETTDEGKPFLHFWCQVKSREEFLIDTKSNSCQIEIDDIDYWMAQPVPVFIFYVPLTPVENKIVPLFICCLSEFSLIDRERQKSVKLVSSFKIENDDELKKFLKIELKHETYKWGLSKGRITWLPELVESYTRKFPTGISQKYEWKFKDSLWQTLWRLSEDILGEAFNLETLSRRDEFKENEKEIIEKARPYIEALKIIVNGRNIPQCNSFATFGVLAELDGDLNKAEGYFKEAIKRIDSDTNLKPLPPDWQNIRDKYENHLKRSSGKMIAGQSKMPK